MISSFAIPTAAAAGAIAVRFTPVGMVQFCRGAGDIFYVDRHAIKYRSYFFSVVFFSSSLTNSLPVKVFYSQDSRFIYSFAT